MLGLFGSSSTPVLGIDISSTSVKLLEIVRSGKGYKMESYAIEPLPPNSVVDKRLEDVEAVGQTIQKAYRRSGSKNKHAAVAVSGSTVITKVITMPANLTEDELEEQIALEADQYIPYPLEEVNLDFSVMGPTEGSPDLSNVLLAASQSQNVDDRTDALAIAGLETKVVDVEAYCVEHTFDLMRHQIADEGIDKVVAIVDIGATTTTVTVIYDGNIIYTRDQAFGGKQLTEEIMRRYGLTYEEAGQKKRQGGLPGNYENEVLQPYKDNLVQQVGRSLQFFYSSSSYNNVDHVLLAGGTAALPGIDTYVEKGMGVPVSVADPIKGMKSSSRVNMERVATDAPALMISLGLALRSFD